MNFRTLSWLMRSSKDDKRISLLAIIAFTVSVGVCLTVVGGFHAFWIRNANAHILFHDAETIQYTNEYILLATVALGLIIAPLATLSAQAARLTLRRRDQKLAILRLIGATQTQTTLLALADSTAQALTGSLCGCLLYVCAIPLVRLLVFQGLPFTFSQLWVGFPLMLSAVAAVTLICLMSAWISLRRVNVSPLGVSMRTRARGLSKTRLIAGILIVIIVMILFSSRFGSQIGIVAVLATIFIGFSAVVGALNLVGPWIISVWARLRVRHPRNAAHLIGLRRIIDNPKRAWRSSAGVGLAIFVCAIAAASSVMSQGMGKQSAASRIYLADIGTGGKLTLAFVALLAAVSAMVTQSAMVYDQKDHYLSLTMEGADHSMLDQARRVETVAPLLIVSLISAGCGLLILSTAGAGLMMSSGFLLSYVLMVTACLSLVIVGGLASRLASRQVTKQLVRQDD
ncbi:transporter [Scardovia inopinata]|uniref:ABC3 transporter permease C-terminal domain-containing protein n=1 Tax=Scardovia inopinata F0304 TaxID=641146 RepID=W5IH37_SCAIO|nr:FtsX-like permease family protein [Scardovia inopinata]EFG26309.1 hypothetical protein HMPREF9020_01394 [Scardovia inopinata F0304]BAR07054.1 putative transport protein [Scardovia inopinata JCM 12537]SUV51123.1 transporter [Scardovia inopinata]